MIVLASAACVQKRIEESFSDTVADLDSKATSNNISSWYKLFGTSFGTSGGKVSTTTTSNTAYALRNGYKSFRATASLDGSTGGDAIYFRVKDANNWMRIREYSGYGASGSTCGVTTSGGYATDWSIYEGCYGITSNVADPYIYGTFCGTTMIAGTQTWEFRPECGTLSYKLMYSYSYGYQEASFPYQYYDYYVAIEKMENGVLTTVGTPKSVSRNSQANPSRSVTLTVTPTSISYNGDSVTDTITNSDLSEWAGVGIGRGTSSVYTSSGLNNLTIDIL